MDSNPRLLRETIQSMSLRLTVSLTRNLKNDLWRCVENLKKKSPTLCRVMSWWCSCSCCWTCSCTYMHMFVFMHIFVYLYAYVRVYAYVRELICICSWTYMHMFVYMHMFLYAYVRVSLYMHMVVYYYAYLHVYAYVRVYANVRTVEHVRVLVQVSNNIYYNTVSEKIYEQKANAWRVKKYEKRRGVFYLYLQ